LVKGMQVPSAVPAALQVELKVPLLVPWPQASTWQSPWLQTVTRFGQSLVWLQPYSQTWPPASASKTQRSGQPQSSCVWHGLSSTGGTGLGQPLLELPELELLVLAELALCALLVLPELLVLPLPAIELEPTVLELLAPALEDTPLLVPVALALLVLPVLEAPVELDPDPGSQMPRSGSGPRGCTQGPLPGQVDGSICGLQSVWHCAKSPSGRQTWPTPQAFCSPARVADGSQISLAPPPWKQSPTAPLPKPTSIGTQDPSFAAATSQVPSSQPLGAPARPPQRLGWQLPPSQTV
jgi:hypothetical protein